MTEVISLGISLPSAEKKKGGKKGGEPNTYLPTTYRPLEKRERGEYSPLNFHSFRHSCFYYLPAIEEKREGKGGSKGKDRSEWRKDGDTSILSSGFFSTASKGGRKGVKKKEKPGETSPKFSGKEGKGGKSSRKTRKGTYSSSVF